MGCDAKARGAVQQIALLRPRPSQCPSVVSGSLLIPNSSVPGPKWNMLRVHFLFISESVPGPKWDRFGVHFGTENGLHFGCPGHPPQGPEKGFVLQLREPKPEVDFYAQASKMPLDLRAKGGARVQQVPELPYYILRMAYAATPAAAASVQCSFRN